MENLVLLALIVSVVQLASALCKNGAKFCNRRGVCHIQKNKKVCKCRLFYYGARCEHIRLVKFREMEIPSKQTTPQFRISHGSEVESIEKIPWQASLRIKHTHQHYGGAVVLSEMWLLTAKHNINGFRYEDPVTGREVSAGIQPRDMEVVVGSLDCTISSDEAAKHAQRKLVNVRKFVEYPKAGGQRHDVALIRLIAKLKFDETIKPAQLPSASILEYDHCTVSGWGRTEDTNAVMPWLRMSSKLNIIAPKTCDTTFKDYLGLVRRVFPTTLCANSDGKSDACKGDSGGPLTCNTRRKTSHNNQEVVVGIVSSGTSCGGTVYAAVPGVYVDITHYIPWMKSHIGSLKTVGVTNKIITHGQWSLWTTWGACSSTCGFGSRLRSRKCNSPGPNNGGRTCLESAEETQNCETKCVYNPKKTSASTVIGFAGTPNHSAQYTAFMLVWWIGVF